MSDLDGLKPYVPAVVDYPDDGQSEFVLYDGATYTRHGEFYDELLDMETGRVVGFRWPTKRPPACANPLAQSRLIGAM
jgi:hypothetical protein